MLFEPLAGKTFGAEVVGGADNLAAISDADFSELEAGLVRYGALLIRRTAPPSLTKQQQAAFGARFGHLEFGGAPMANTEEPGGAVLDVGLQRMRTNIGNEMWHTDSTYKPLSSKVAMLSARELPPSGGGETALVDMCAAYDRLDEATQLRIQGLSAWHSTQYSQAADMGDFPPVSSQTIYHGAAYLRPLVKRHPVSGRRAIFAGRHAFGVCATDEPSRMLPRGESQALLASLVTAATAEDEATWTHRWSVGDTLVWDNRRLLHRALP
jgi:alpha-ketoglutarate-dependent taurine dioxygenase